MATKSAARSARRAQRRRNRTRSAQGEVRSGVSRARRLLATGDKAAPEAVYQAISSLDRASGRGVIHPNTAGRHKALLARKLNQKLGAK